MMLKNDGDLDLVNGSCGEVGVCVFARKRLDLETQDLGFEPVPADDDLSKFNDLFSHELKL